MTPMVSGKFLGLLSIRPFSDRRHQGAQYKACFTRRRVGLPICNNPDANRAIAPLEQLRFSASRTTPVNTTFNQHFRIADRRPPTAYFVTFYMKYGLKRKQIRPPPARVGCLTRDFCERSSTRSGEQPPSHSRRVCTASNSSFVIGRMVFHARDAQLGDCLGLGRCALERGGNGGR
jgi:hypothetical protein